MTDSSNSVPDDKFIRQLEIAIADLLWLSESESPFWVIYWCDYANCDRHAILQHQYPAQTKIEVQKFSDFFASATQEQSWHNQEEQEEVKKYQALVDLLTKNLTDLRVYLVGSVEIEVYILGMNNRAIAGLLTKIVAT
jgi:hypothetical protein